MKRHLPALACAAVVGLAALACSASWCPIGVLRPARDRGPVVPTLTVRGFAAGSPTAPR